jgi:TPR repeat protein
MGKAAALAIACSLAGPALAQTFEEAVVAQERGDYGTAAQVWRQLADKGSAAARYRLGMMYAAGQGVPQNQGEAAKWVRLAAEQGSAAAQYQLGWMYEKGVGVQQSNAEWARWMRQAATQGDSNAMYELGLLHVTGLGVPQDFVRAHMWLNLAAARGNATAAMARNSLGPQMSAAEITEAQRMAREWKPTAAAPVPAAMAMASVAGPAPVGGPLKDAMDAYWRRDYATALTQLRPLAEKGDAGAQNWLGSMYLAGDGVPQDYAEAEKWLRLAANQGNADAQNSLGEMYTEAQGVPYDFKLAHMWFNLAAAAGDKDALQNRAGIAAEMTRDQIAEAQKMAREWKPTAAPAGK